MDEWKITVWEPTDADAPKVRARLYVDGVPYYGGGNTLRECLAHLCDVLRDHGAPEPGQKRSTELKLTTVDSVD